MKTFTTNAQRAAMVPSSVRKLLDLLNMRDGMVDARVAGGAVRDSLRGQTPKDWDVATVYSPSEVTAFSNKAGYKVLPTGLEHGTVTVMVDDEAIEVTTLRIDVETDGRHAEVEFTTNWREDAARRDLTMNAMFMHADGSVDDFFGGQEDMANGVVRFVGKPSARMQEDYLRILRFFRFSGQMEVEFFDKPALRAARSNSPGLVRVSRERIWMEFRKILGGNMLGEVLDTMRHIHVLYTLGMGKTDVSKAVAASMHSVVRPETVLAALVDDKYRAVELAAELKMSRTEQNTVAFVSNHTKDLLQLRTLGDWKRMAVVHGKDNALQLLCLTARTEFVKELDAWKVPTFPVTGKHLMKAGVAPGPDMGVKLKDMHNRWVESDFVMNKEELLKGA
jgi:tRNA nucleotidyltransferase (CCA-adding enzyme)